MLIQRDNGLAPAKGDRPKEGAWTQASLSDTAELVALLERVVSAMAKYGYPPRTRRELRLVLEEAVVNGLRHGPGPQSRRRSDDGRCGFKRLSEADARSILLGLGCQGYLRIAKHFIQNLLR